jgi:hypothetical protein
MDDETDEAFNIYHDIIRKRSMKIVADQNSIMTRGLESLHRVDGGEEETVRKK